jgi:hypothetical protein
MSSILLGPLGYPENNILTRPKSRTRNDLNSIYSSDMENKIKMIERQQAGQDFSQPEYLKQFDQLRLDNVGEPVGLNETHATTNGKNVSLQRHLDFANGYSVFQQNDMHYDVVTMDQFTHNNMIPSTSRRDYDKNSDRVQRKLETFTGNFNHYTPKKEKTPLFEPMANLTWVNGMPSITGKLQNRYNPSNKNNYGNLPFENNVKVRPGLAMDNQEGNYAVYRIMPRNVDALRSEINQKVTYENKPLETIKKGEIRAPDPVLTQFKMPDFREVNFADLMPGRFVVEAQKQTGTYTNVISQRNEEQIYRPGPSVNTNQGDGPDKKKTRFEPSKRESFMNDPTHAVVDVNNKPVMTNANSYSNTETQRASTNIEYEGPVSNAAAGNSGLYIVDYKDVPLTTLRELMIHGNTNIGISGSQEKGNYIFSNDMVLPITQRQINSDKKPILGATSMEKSAPVYNEDKAKLTIRQATSHNMITNAVSQDKSVPVYNEDKAKLTIRQTTSHNMITNAVSQDKSVPVYNDDKAKLTIRQGTSHNLAINVKPTEGTGYSEFVDKAKLTIRQSTTFTTPEINIRSEIPNSNIGLQDDAKPTIKQTTLISNRPTGNASLALAPYSRDLNDSAKNTQRQTTENTQYVGHANSNGIESSYVRDLNDSAKTTQRQTTENTQYVGHANSNSIESSYVRDKEDSAKPTQRQTTENNQYIGQAKNQSLESSYARDVNDEARPTIKQTTLLQNYTGILRGENEKKISHEAANNMTIDERREISMYNRAPNARKDLNGPYIDEENVRMNDRRDLYSYVSHPFKMLDQNVMPNTSQETIRQVYSMSKPVIETSSYYINSNFINTLKNNPLVNDIYHQKNIN